MPELPEVETIRRGLLPRVLNLRIEDAVIGDPKVFQLAPDEFIVKIRGEEIRSLVRRGKYLNFELESWHLIIHLGMTGQLTLVDADPNAQGQKVETPLMFRPWPTGPLPDRHTHLQLFLENKLVLMLRDVRKFGKVSLLSKGSPGLDAAFAHLGVEPLGEDYRLDSFLSGMGKRKTPVKALLLDQSFVAGIGNIYADECLFLSGVRPTRRVYRLHRSEKVRIFESIPLVLEKGIRYGGTSMRDFVNSDGALGSHQEQLNVYGREGKDCRRCGAVIRKIRVAQRGTYFCPDCQKK